jgi:hypothetical protein
MGYTRKTSKKGGLSLVSLLVSTMETPEYCPNKAISSLKEHSSPRVSSRRGLDLSPKMPRRSHEKSPSRLVQEKATTSHGLHSSAHGRLKHSPSNEDLTLAKLAEKLPDRLSSPNDRWSATRTSHDHNESDHEHSDMSDISLSDFSESSCSSISSLDGADAHSFVFATKKAPKLPATPTPTQRKQPQPASKTAKKISTRSKLQSASKMPGPERVSPYHKKKVVPSAQEEVRLLRQIIAPSVHGMLDDRELLGSHPSQEDTNDLSDRDLFAMIKGGSSRRTKSIRKRRAQAA